MTVLNRKQEAQATEQQEPFDSVIQMQLLPAFKDLDNQQVFLSRYADGTLAPTHVYDGLPQLLLQRREMNVISGFIFAGEFLTGDQAFLRLSDIRN